MKDNVSMRNLAQGARDSTIRRSLMAPKMEKQLSISTPVKLSNHVEADLSKKETQLLRALTWQDEI